MKLHERLVNTCERLVRRVPAKQRALVVVVAVIAFSAIIGLSLILTHDMVVTLINKIPALLELLLRVLTAVLGWLTLVRFVKHNFQRKLLSQHAS